MWTMIRRFATATAALLVALSPATAGASSSSIAPHVMLDSGHGGRYPGAVNCDWRSVTPGVRREASPMSPAVVQVQLVLLRHLVLYDDV